MTEVVAMLRYVNGTRHETLRYDLSLEVGDPQADAAACCLWHCFSVKVCARQGEQNQAAGLQLRFRQPVKDILKRRER
jgi:hypothetical protein